MKRLILLITLTWLVACMAPVNEPDGGIGGTGAPATKEPMH